MKRLKIYCKFSVFYDPVREERDVTESALKGKQHERREQGYGKTKENRMQERN